MKLKIFSLILMCCAYSFNINAVGLKGVWFTQAMQTMATKVNNATGKVTSAAGMALFIAATCLNFSACDVPSDQINQIIGDGQLALESGLIDLDTHEGLILVERGGLLTMQATPNSITAQIDVGMLVLGEDGEWVAVDPGIEETYLSNVQLAILDGEGEAIEGALMMWHQPELQAKQVDSLAVFKDIFVPVYLPDGAQLYMTGAVRGEGEGYYFNIVTLEPSGIDLTIEKANFVIETLPPIDVHVHFLNYEPSIAGSAVEWYAHFEDNSSNKPVLSTVMQLQSYLGRPAILMHQRRFNNFPDRYRLVTRVIPQGEGKDSVAIVDVD